MLLLHFSVEGGEGGREVYDVNFYMDGFNVLICSLCKKMAKKFQKIRKFVTRTPVSTNRSFTFIFLRTLYISSQFR